MPPSRQGPPQPEKRSQRISNQKPLDRKCEGSVESGESAITLKEERVSDDPRRRHYELKNGSRIEARWGGFHFERLVNLLQHEPGHFQGLLALARETPREVAPDTLRYLTEAGGFLREGVIEQGVKDVLLSSYRETVEGVVLVNPFRLADQTQADELQRQEDDNLRWLLRELGLEEDRDRPPGRR